MCECSVATQQKKNLLTNNLGHRNKQKADTVDRAELALNPEHSLN